MPTYVDVASNRKSPPKPGNININELIDKIETGVLQIPRFQRDFVWKPKDSAGLIDSILHNYPIGTITLWMETDYRLLTAELGGVHFPQPLPGHPTNYVLDGQQRLTSIYAVIKGMTVRNQDYSKIYLLLEGENDDGNLVVVNVDGLNPDQYISIKDLYLFDAVSIINRYGAESVGVIQKYSDRLRNYPIPSVAMNGASIEVATDIFTRINTQGKRLSLVEVMNAKVYDEQREFDLNIKREEQKEAWENSNFNTIADTTVMQALGLCLKGNAKGNVILSLSRDEVIDNWDKLNAAFSNAIDYLRTSYYVPGSKFLPYDAMLLPYVYYFFHHASPNIDPAHEPYLRDYFWRCGLTQRYTEGLVSKVTQDVEMVSKLFQGTLPVNRPPVNISEQSIVQNGEFKSSSAYSRTFLCLYAAQLPRSFNTGNLVLLDNTWLASSSNKNDHHFFPKAYMNEVAPSKKKIVNNVVNITLIDSYLNKVIIGKRPPSEYMSDCKECNPNLASTMLTHLVGDLDDFGITTNDYDKFFSQRVKAIQQKFVEQLIPNADDILS